MNRDRPWWVVLFGDKVMMAALVAIWGAPVFALFQLSIGQVAIGISVFIASFPCFWWMVKECDRRHLVRGWLTVASTIGVVAIFGLIFWQII